ncbi:tRNA (N(6)-L-threonylcarbamoyladenosine(37)-C(2))-methylthiotransferase [Candidatus Woesearchaeota archaeon]|nr:tRNA (N(6)-L-threonylcarbamoyladenosine(37)-C(2))-methylthiotransferase [Candidatus Woesearchaeota archaeon]
MNIFIRTFGCTLNQSDSEVMAGLLVKAGHKLANNIEDAELVLFNTCTVKDKPEKRFFSELQKVVNQKKKVVVAGCIAQSDAYNALLKKVSLVGVRNIHKIADVVDNVKKGKVVKFLDFSPNPRLNLPKTRKNSVVEIIPIANGCLGECSYCKTRFARGRLFSYDACAIKKQFENAIHDGVKEVWLTSQDCGAYGKDVGSSIIKLLDDLLSVKMNSNVRIRLGMLNPNHALEFLDDYVKALKHPNMFRFAHLPVQSGSNDVLKAMNRKYSIEDFVMIVERLRKEIPNITIATDIIVGFPGEAEEDFEKTFELLANLRIPVVNLTKFCPRPGTPAMRMKKISTKIVKARSKKIVELRKETITNSEWLGWAGNIIIDEVGKNNSVVGRNDYYRPVVVKNNTNIKLGDVVNVRIIRGLQDYLEGTLV